MHKRLLHSFSFGLSVALVLMMALGGPSRLQAQTYYFPGSNYNYTGGNNSWPFSAGTMGGSYMCQWLYLPSDFNSTPTGNVFITTIYIKPGSSGTYTYSNMLLKLGNTSLTTLTSGTWNSGLTTVYNPSSVTITTSSGSWLAITLSTPFLYTGGGLIFEASHQTSIGIGGGFTINQYNVSSRNGRMYGVPTSTSSSGADVATAVFGFDCIPAACSGTPTAATITNAAMNPATPICAGGTATLSASSSSLGTGITYQWQSGSSSTGPFTNVSSGSGATTLNYTTGALYSTTWFRLATTCTNSSITSYSTPYQVLVGAPQPGAISGVPTFCPGDVLTYSVPNVPGTTYTWTLPSGWTGTSTGSSIMVTAGSTPGTISVSAASACGSSIARTKSVAAGSSPATPGAISGKGLVCKNSSYTYTAPAVPGAQYYVWSLPSGWTGTSSTNSITILTDTTSGPISVRAVNNCGLSQPSSRSISVISSLPNPSAISTSSTSGIYCAGQLYNFKIQSVPGATSYVWTLPTGWSGTNSDTSIMVYAGSSGTVSVVAYVSCAASAPSAKSITVQSAVTPTVSVSTATSPVCQGALTTFNANSTNAGNGPVYVWRKNGVVVPANGSQYLDNRIATGDIISATLVSNATCRTMDTVTSAPLTLSVTPKAVPGISINSTPVVTICQGTPIYLSTTTTSPGTTPRYQWYVNGVAVSGATSTTYSTSTSANNDSISVSMTSNAVCATDSIAQSNKVGIIVKPLISPTVSVSASSTQPSPGMPITFTAMVTGGGPTPTFQWILNNVEIAGATNQTYVSSDLIAGDRVMVRMQSYAECANPSVVTSDEVLMQNPTGVGAQSNWQGALAVYPNPSTGRFTIAAEAASLKPGEQLRIEVMSLVGQRVFEKELTAGAGANGLWKAEVELGSQLAAGQYMLRLSTQSGMSAVLPITLQR